MKDIWQFFIGIFYHWIPLVTGGLIMAALGVFEHRTGRSVPWSWYASILILFFLYSCFVTWRDEYRVRIKLVEQAKPKLSIQFKGSSQRPEMQDLGFCESLNGGFLEQRLFRVAIRNESSVSIKGAQLVLESVESDQRESFFPGHALRIMGSRAPLPQFDIGAGSTQWVDLVGCTLRSSGEYFYVPYAELGERWIPLGRHTLVLRADGGGLPSRAQVIVNCPEQGLFGVSEFQVLE